MKILFQGDSITDAGRVREETAPNRGLGMGYVNLIASNLTCDRDDIEVFNRAISGDRIADTYHRWLEDMRNIDFDILSFMSGMNDTGFGIRMGMGSDMERYEFIYDRMLYEVKQSHPESVIILIQPFVFRMKDESNNCDIYNDWDKWCGEIEERGRITKKLAEKYGARYLPMFEIFKEAQKKFPAEHWSVDCIHPTPAGYELIARNWIDAMADIVK